MRITHSEIVAVIRTRDRRHASDVLDRERFLAPNDLVTRLRSTAREKREYLLHYLVGTRLDADAVSSAWDLLTDFDFLAAKVAEGLLPELLRDCDSVLARMSAGDARALSRLRRALELSRFLLEDDPGQLPEQLLGRLDSADSRGLGLLLARARDYKQEPWLRPLAATLTTPDSPLKRTLVGPPGRIMAIALFPDSRTWLSASESTLTLWHLDGVPDQLPLPGREDATDLLVSPDSRFAVLAVRGDTIQVWDLEKKRLRHRLAGHSSAVLTLVMAPSGRLLSGSTDGTIRVWDLESGQPLAVLDAGVGVHALAMLPDERHLLSAGGGEPGFLDQNCLTLWELDTGERLPSFAGHDWPIDAVAVTDDGQDVILAANDVLEIWDLGRRTLRHSLQNHRLRIRSLAAVPRQRLAVAGGSDGTVTLWNLETGERVRSLRAHQSDVIDVAVTPDGSCVVSASWDQTLRVWDLPLASEPERRHGHTAGIGAVLVTPDQRWAVSASDDHTLLVWDLATFASVRELRGHAAWVRALALAADGRRLLSASWDGTLRLWDLATGETLRSLALGKDEHFEAAAIAPSGSRAVAGTYSGKLVIWDLEHADSPPRVFKAHDKSISALVLLDACQGVLLSSDDGTLERWDLEHELPIAILDPGTPVPTLSGAEVENPLDPSRLPGPRWTAICLLPGERRALTASSAGTLAHWHLESGAREDTWTAAPAGITGLAVTPRGRLAAAASGRPSDASDNTLRIWDLETRQPVARFVGESPFLSCAACADGATFVAGDQLGRVHFLRLETPGESRPPR
jgi:WD40 repeat protein